MEGIILIIIIGLISTYYSKIKEYTAEKGLGQPGMPPFPKGRPIFNDEIDEYEYEMYDVKTKTNLEEMEREDHLGLENIQKEANTKSIGTVNVDPMMNNIPNVMGNMLQEISDDSREDYIDDLFHIDNVKRGIIWQEILEEPRARRLYRR